MCHWDHTPKAIWLRRGNLLSDRTARQARYKGTARQPGTQSSPSKLPIPRAQPGQLSITRVRLETASKQAYSISRVLSSAGAFKRGNETCVSLPPSQIGPSSKIERATYQPCMDCGLKRRLQRCGLQLLYVEGFLRGDENPLHQRTSCKANECLEEGVHDGVPRLMHVEQTHKRLNGDCLVKERPSQPVNTVGSSMRQLALVQKYDIYGSYLRESLNGADKQPRRTFVTILDAANVSSFLRIGYWRTGKNDDYSIVGLSGLNEVGLSGFNGVVHEPT